MEAGSVMSRESYDQLIWGLLVLGCVAVLYFLSGCAGPEPAAPIAAYRAAYGFHAMSGKSGGLVLGLSQRGLGGDSGANAGAI